MASKLSERLCESFAECKLAKCCTRVQPAFNDENSNCKIRNVLYLKGLDAYQQILHKQDGNENQASKRADRLSAIDLHNPPPLPIGPSQFDYFHRLAQQIRDPHNEINREKRDSGIKAVIVFGSDFYDKLLILEALRAEMPNILVLTTGLDAQMLHPQHWRSARNLVVASHFDLLLNGKYQKEFPPFRDSRQTEIFYRTISSVTNHIPDQVGKSGITSSQIFEIGRNGPVRLGPIQENEDSKYHPSDNALEQAIERLCLLTAIIFLLICFFYAIRPNSRKLSSGLLMGTLVIFVIALVFATNESGEPLSFTDGVSLWPTIFIQFIAIMMAVAFFLRARGELDENFCRLSRQYFSTCLDKSKNYFPTCPKDRGWELSKLSRSGILPWTILTILLTFFIYAINDVSPSDLQFGWCLALLMLIAIVYFVITEFNVEPGKDNFNSVKDWAEKGSRHAGETSQNKYYLRIRDALHELCTPFRSGNSSPELCQGKYEDGLWGEYYNYGLIDHRVIRVVQIWLFFAIIETILIYLLPLWPLPCRDTSCYWASGTGVTSFTVIMLLLFFVLDAVRLSFYWIQKLRKQHPLLADRYSPRDNNPLESLENIVAVVAERTRVVDKLIYYPMLCIMLMLFAKTTYFDNQDFPLSKGITFAASISLLFFSGFMLRYEAKKLKLSVIKSVENLGKKDLGKNKERSQVVINRINDICEGAFKPMFEQPVMRALLIILASIGLFTGEYLKLLG